MLETEDDWKVKISNAVLFYQGAEALLYRCQFLEMKTVVKERLRKSYRHPILDKKINEKRIRIEARIMSKVAQIDGILVPSVYFVDKRNLLIFMEEIDGCTIKAYFKYKQTIEKKLGDSTDKINKNVENNNHSIDDSDNLENDRKILSSIEYSSQDIIHGYSCELISQMDQKNNITLKEIAFKIGRVIANLHKAGIIHGDLTTSNIMLNRENIDIVLIDFGLSFKSFTIEDRAVDLYVLERAFLATHPDFYHFFQLVLDTYEKEGMEKVIKKLAIGEEKRSLWDEMIGTTRNIELKGSVNSDEIQILK